MWLPDVLLRFCVFYRFWAAFLRVLFEFLYRLVRLDVVNANVGFVLRTSASFSNF